MRRPAPRTIIRISVGCLTPGSEEVVIKRHVCCPAWRHVPETITGGVMSVYKVIEVIGTSATSWEDAAAQAVKTAGETLEDLRVAEVVRQDIHVDESGEIIFRVKLELSFKYVHHEHQLP